jgi:hypothetical protein
MQNHEFRRIQNELLKNFSQPKNSPLFKVLDTFNKISRFYNKNKKIIYGIISITLLISVVSFFIFKEPKGVFKITTNNEIYNTNEVELVDGCAYFTRNKNNQKIILCGDFKIEENN